MARFAHAARAARAARDGGAAVAITTPVEDMRRAHKQVMQQARLESKFASAPKAWLDWSAVQATRARVVRAYEAGKDDDEDERAQRQRLFDATLLTWLTTVPPDRVGVTRQLQLGVTLKARADGGFDLDLSQPGLHKTSAVFGPTVTRVPEAACALLTAWLRLTGRAAAAQPFVFVAAGADAAAALGAPQWTKLVKALFKRHTGVPLAPKDLRSSFVTFLLSAENTDEQLKKAVALAMRHSAEQQAGPAYDKARAERMWAAAVDVVGEHAAKF